MNREKMLHEVQTGNAPWDVLIIGGGATGLGAAVDAASRGYRTLLLEQSDFAKGTSSRSTKLIHGGLRYLQQGNISLVKEALKERGLLCKNAPHLIHHLPFLVPNYHWWEGSFYGIGLKIYDLLAGKLGIERSKHLSVEKILKEIPTLEPKGLRGGVIYYDGQFDDARLAITLAKTAVEQGAAILNYMKVTRLLKENGKCIGVRAQNQENKKTIDILAKVIINATGIFTDTILQLDNPHAKKIIAPSQGIHVVLDRSFLPSDTAIIIPHTEDNRVLFMVPWHQCVLLGTTDTPISKVSLEPKPFQQELDFLLKHAGKYLIKQPRYEDIRSMFAGIRPLIKGSSIKATAKLSRDHYIHVTKSNLITIAGGKWTTYRKMGEDVINKAVLVGGLRKKSCKTKTLKLAGWCKRDPLEHFSPYGSEAKTLLSMQKKNKSLQQLIHPNLPYQSIEVVWAARKEMARCIEDVLARRTRILFLDAKASIEAAPLVAKILAKELKKSLAWQKAQIKSFTKLAKQYLPSNK